MSMAYYEYILVVLSHVYAKKGSCHVTHQGYSPSRASHTNGKILSFTTNKFARQKTIE